MAHKCLQRLINYDGKKRSKALKGGCGMKKPVIQKENSIINSAAVIGKVGGDKWKSKTDDEKALYAT